VGAPGRRRLPARRARQPWWCGRRVCRNWPAEVGIMAAQTPAHRDPSRTLRPDSRVAQGLREPDYHRLHRRSGNLGPRSTYMEPRGL